MTRTVCAILLIAAAGCAGRYVGPGSGTREERVQQRDQQRAESTAVEDPRAPSAQEQRAIDSSGLPVAP